MNHMTIGKAATKAGVGVETIRFYQRKGLIEQIREALEALITACPGRGALRECSILDALTARAHPDSKSSR